MKAWLVVLFLITSNAVFAGGSLKFKGELLSYSDTHFKLKEKNVVHKIEIRNLPQVQIENLHKLLNKQIEVQVPL